MRKILHPDVAIAADDLIVHDVGDARIDAQAPPDRRPRDALTGLLTRAALLEAIDRANARHGGCDSCALLTLDLVRFSRVKECVGTLGGDEIIRLVAARLRAALGDGPILARTTGDEFGVLLRLVDGPGDALHAARRMEAAFAEPFRLHDLEIHIDCAIGCALSTDLSRRAEDALRSAHVALMRAKRSGHIELYQPGQANEARRRFSLETDLRRAIERDELRLVFQPLVDLTTGTTTGFEALARWRHPDHGTIDPVEFIAVAEDSGLIVPLGRWALGSAARALAAWDAAAGRRLPIRMSVNVSAVQLARDSLVDAVEASGCDVERLTLELTESAIVADPARTTRVFAALHARGCHVAMDDFGTGYSCLASFQKLPIDVLKIDCSFVTDMIENRDSAAIVGAVLSLAQSRGIATLAEGIEHAATARMLASLGCAMGQGFHLARPLAQDGAYAWLMERSA